jgi:predicted transcriptional regulator
MPEEIQVNLERDTTEIVAAYLRHNQMPTDQVGSLITTVYSALKNMGSPPEVEERTPAVPVRRSVHQDYVVCLECGWRGKMLRRHISSAHELTPAEYRARWSLSREHPLTAPGYSEQRSGLAKQSGLGRGRRRANVATESPQPEARPKPKRSSSRRRSAAPT